MLKCHIKTEFVLPQTLCAYSISFFTSNFSSFFFVSSGVEFYRTLSKLRKRIRKLLPCVHDLHKTWKEAFSCRSRVAMAKKCPKRRDARAELLFCQSTKPIAFSPFSLTPTSSLLKLLLIS